MSTLDGFLPNAILSNSSNFLNLAFPIIHMFILSLLTFLKLMCRFSDKLGSLGIHTFGDFGFF